MNKKQFFPFSFFFLIIFSVISSNSALSSNEDIPPGYYDGTASLNGLPLKVKLHSIIRNHIKRTYTQVREDLKITDEDPNNSNNVILLYKGTSSPKTNFGGEPDNWNREHVWPSSHGFSDTDTAYSDLHHLRPTDVSVNGDRGNKDFDNGGNPHPEAIGNFYDADSWEARDAVKGDVARMVFYMAVRYEENGNYDLELADFTGTSSPNLGVLSTLLDWHSSDPVDQFEMDRHEAVYEIQGNRNPFIDHPEFVSRIWADTGTVEPPVTGNIYISEVSDAASFPSEYIELYNNSADTISLQNSKLIRLSDLYVFDFSTDGSGDIFILPFSLIVIGRGAAKTEFETNWGPLPAGVSYNQGIGDLFFGTSLSRQWILKEGGTANSNDGNTIDDTIIPVAGTGKRSYQQPIGTWNTENNIIYSTPGVLDPDQVLPVELTYFSAYAVNGGVLLKWQTATELNNFGFEIQKRTDEDFSGWINCGFVSGAGTSSNIQQYQFFIPESLTPKTMFFRLKQIDNDGSFSFSEIRSVSISLPGKWELHQNYPNPFNPSTTIEFALPVDGHVKLEVFNQIGERINTIVNKSLHVGQHKFQFDGSTFSSGVYFYRLTTAEKILINKMILAK